MKRFLLFALLLGLLQSTYAQDQIVKLNGDEIPARVLEISLQEVIYRHPDSLGGKAHSIPKADVFMVRFANGTKEVFADNLPAEQPEEASPEEMYLLGRQDAQQYYSGSGALWGSAGLSLFIPYGYAGVAAIMLTKPRAFNHQVSDSQLLSNPDYVRGYEAKARSKKTGKALIGAGIGTATVFTIAIMILSASWGA